jgi:DNA-binding MarR family transcriptional regulator
MIRSLGSSKPDASDGRSCNRTLLLLAYLTHIGSRSAEGSMADGALKTRHFVLLMLLGNHGPIGQQGLAEILCLSPNNVVILLDELETRNLATRRRDPTDRRRHIVAISPEGSAALRSVERELADTEDNLLRALSSDERSTLDNLLIKAVSVQLLPSHLPTTER